VCVNDYQLLTEKCFIFKGKQIIPCTRLINIYFTPSCYSKGGDFNNLVINTITVRTVCDDY